MKWGIIWIQINKKKWLIYQINISLNKFYFNIFNMKKNKITKIKDKWNELKLKWNTIHWRNKIHIKINFHKWFWKEMKIDIICWLFHSLFQNLNN